MPADRLIHLAASWLLTYVIHSTLLLGCVMALVPLLKRRERLAEALWRMGLLGGIISASVQSWTMSPVRPGGFDWYFGPDPRAGAAAPLPAFASTLLSRLNTPILTAGLLLCFLIALAGLLGLVHGRLVLRRLLRRRVNIKAHPLGHRLRTPAVGAVRVTVSSQITTPMVLGTGELCFPERALQELSDEELSSVLAHEMAHLERHDPAWLLLTNLVAKAFFIQPLNILALKRLRDLAEFLCDDSAMRQTGSQVALASALATVAEWGAATPRITAVGMVGRGSLTVVRVRRILEGCSPAVERSLSVPGLLVIMSPLIGLAAFGPAVAIPLDQVGVPTGSYIISAVDNAGSFAVRVDRGKVLGIVVDGAELPAEAVVQRGSRVHVRGGSGRVPFDLTLTPEGGIRWVSRPAEPPHSPTQ